MQTCHDYAERYTSAASEAWNAFDEHQEVLVRNNSKPIAAYSKRSSRLAEFRSLLTWSNERDDGAAPTKAAISAAEIFINDLVNDVLKYQWRAAISADGEINFFFGRADELFQILILDEGALSYHAQNADGELVESEIQPGDFPHMKLLGFLNRRQ